MAMADRNTKYLLYSLVTNFIEVRRIFSQQCPIPDNKWTLEWVRVLNSNFSAGIRLHSSIGSAKLLERSPLVEVCVNCRVLSS